jgi:MFS family permease
LTPPADSLSTRPFVTLCVATFLFYLGFQMLIPVMPLYAARLGAGEGQIGLIIGVFAFSAMFLRPVTGELADRIGRYPLVLAGSAIFGAAAIAYPALGWSISALIAIRVFHGIGMGLGPTAGTVMVADLAPAHRRGEAMGLYGMAGNASLAVAPYLGAALLERGGFAPAFAGSAGLELISLLVATQLPETRPPGARTPRSGRWVTGLFHAGALYPSLLCFAMYFPFGAVFTFVPLFARQREIANIGPFFTAFALSAVVVRGLAGRLADRVGRRMVAAPSLGLAAGALLVLAGADATSEFIAAAVLLGLGFGAAQPAILAMTADRVPPEARGRALGTLYTALELAIGGGAVLLGLWAARRGYPSMFRLGAACTGLGALAAARHVTRLRG